MNIEDITLEILQQQNMRTLFYDREWYFHYDDLNEIYDFGFKYTPIIALPFPIEGKTELCSFVSFHDINEQVEHMKNLPSFKSRINHMLGLDPNKFK